MSVLLLIRTPPLKPIVNRLKLADELWSSYINGKETTRREHLTELYHYLDSSSATPGSRAAAFPAQFGITANAWLDIQVILSRLLTIISTRFALIHL